MEFEALEMILLCVYHSKTCFSFFIVVIFVGVLLENSYNKIKRRKNEE